MDYDERSAKEDYYYSPSAPFLARLFQKKEDYENNKAIIDNSFICKTFLEIIKANGEEEQKNKI